MGVVWLEARQPHMKMNTPPTQGMLFEDCRGQALYQAHAKLLSLPCPQALASERKGRNPVGVLLGQKDEHRVEVNSEWSGADRVKEEHGRSN